MSSSGSREPSLTHTTLLLPHSPWEEGGGGGRGEEEGGGRREEEEEGGGEVFSHGL